MQQSPTSKVDARSSDIMVDPPKTSMQSSIMQQTPTLNVNAKSSDIMVDPTKSSMPSSTTHQSPTHKMNAKSSDIMVDPTKSSMPSSIMHQSPTTVQVQPSVVLSSKTSKHTVDPKERSTQQPEIKSSLNSNVATQTPNQTATVTATASAGTTPTFITTSAACSLKHLGFYIHAAFLVILANVFLFL
jgi:ABC-type sulfate/molybdate transport systems ATPase subunit